MVSPTSTTREVVLVTGGAGFIGSHLVDRLLSDGHRVRVIDNLLPQAHPTGEARFLAAEAELIRADIRDAEAVKAALGDDVTSVFHLAGMVGNGQSMYDIHRYIDVNSGGTAVLLQAMVGRKTPFRRLVMSSSMVVYGDGAYRCAEHGVLQRIERAAARMRNGLWEPTCPRCALEKGKAVEVQAVATTEDHRLAPTSTYGISKRDQEELCLTIGASYGLPTVALRYLNAYGSRQALSNPYTGVAAIMAMRLINGKAPLVFEDGGQMRDFVHVSDIVEANIAGFLAPEASCGRAFNVGTGRSITIRSLADRLANALSIPIEPEVTGEFRDGDIRHCFADISRIRQDLEWQPRVDIDSGMTELALWAAGETPTDNVEAAVAELRAKGLLG